MVLWSDFGAWSSPLLFDRDFIQKIEVRQGKFEQGFPWPRARPVCLDRNWVPWGVGGEKAPCRVYRERFSRDLDQFRFVAFNHNDQQVSFISQLTYEKHVT